MKEGKKTNLQIRGVPPQLVSKVRQRATKKSQTMSQFLIDLLEREMSQPSMEEWLEEVRSWKPIPVRGGMTGAQAVREAREERAEQLARRFEERHRGSKR
jgi:hypothetical protein